MLPALPLLCVTTPRPKSTDPTKLPPSMSRPDAVNAEANPDSTRITCGLLASPTASLSPSPCTNPYRRCRTRRRAEDEIAEVRVERELSSCDVVDLPALAPKVMQERAAISGATRCKPCCSRSDT